MKRCPKHPYYKAIRKPRSGCEICAEMYLTKIQVIKNFREKVR